MTTWTIVILFLLVVLAALLFSRFGVAIPFIGGAMSMMGAYDGDSDADESDDDDYTGGKSKRRMFSGEPWISDIESGKKKVECRVGKLEDYKDWNGSEVLVVGGGKKVKAEITGARHYADLDALLKKEGYKNVAPHTSSDKAAKDAMLEIKNKAGIVIYSAENIKEKGGIVAFDLKLVK